MCVSKGIYVCILYGLEKLRMLVYLMSLVYDYRAEYKIIKPLRIREDNYEGVLI